MDFALLAGDRVVGRLVRPDGSAVIGGFTVVNGPGNSRSGRDAVAGRTGADGRFAIDGLRHEVAHTLDACAPRCGRTLVDFGPAPQQSGEIDLGDVTLPAPRSIEGTAFDGEGWPIANANISLRGSNDDRASNAHGATPTTFAAYESRRTDDLGRFRFPDLAPGTYEVNVYVPDAPQSQGTHVVLPADHDVRDVRVPLMGSRSVTLLVVDDSGAPLAGASVQANGFGGGMSYSLRARTGDDGRTGLRGLPAVATTYFVSDAMHPVLYTTVGPFVPDGSEIKVVLHRAVEIRGRIRTRGGTGAPNLNVKARRTRDGAAAGSAWSDDAGSFVVKVPLGEVVDLAVEGEQSVKEGNTVRWRTTGFRGELNGVTGPTSGVEIVVADDPIVNDRAVTVVVQDSAGAPVAGFEVTADVDPKSVRAKTGADGRARLEGMPNRKLNLSLSDGIATERPRPLDVPPRSVDIDRDQQEALVRYRAGAAIRGRVVDAEGRGLRHAVLHVTTDDGASYSLRCEEGGRFVTGGLPGHAHTLSAQGYLDGKNHEGFLAGVIPGDAEITITVAPNPK